MPALVAASTSCFSSPSSVLRTSLFVKPREITLLHRRLLARREVDGVAVDPLENRIPIQRDRLKDQLSTGQPRLDTSAIDTTVTRELDELPAQKFEHLEFGGGTFLLRA